MFKMFKVIVSVTFVLLLTACSKHMIDSKQQERMQQEVAEVYSSAYPLFLQARLGSLNTEITKEACSKGVKAACSDPSFIFDRSDEELKELCARGIGNACYQVSERLIGFPIEDTMPITRIKSNSIQARHYAKKGCDLSFAKACALEGILSLDSQPSHAFNQLFVSCENNSLLGCHALYVASKQAEFKDPTQKPRLMTYAYAKILDFGMDNLLCEDYSCLLTGELADASTMDKECQKGSGLACVALAHLHKRDYKGAYLKDNATQVKWLNLLSPHCFSREYAPACQAIMELYFVRKNGYAWAEAGSIACVSDFYAKGMVRYERESQICTRLGDALLSGVYKEGKEAIAVPKDRERALYLYKIGCERGNEGRACSRLEKALKDEAAQGTTPKKGKAR